MGVRSRDRVADTRCTRTLLATPTRSVFAMAFKGKNFFFFALWIVYFLGHFARICRLRCVGAQLVAESNESEP